MKPPSHIQNVPLWEEHCRMIRARAIDLIDGRLGVIETARAISKLGYWAGVLEDSDIEKFAAINSETDTLVVGDERRLWAQHALEREDIKTAEAEELYRTIALEAAQRIVSRFAWTLEARALRRKN